MSFGQSGDDDWPKPPGLRPTNRPEGAGWFLFAGVYRQMLNILALRTVDLNVSQCRKRNHNPIHEGHEGALSRDKGFELCVYSCASWIFYRLSSPLLICTFFFRKTLLDDSMIYGSDLLLEVRILDFLMKLKVLCWSMKSHFYLTPKVLDIPSDTGVDMIVNSGGQYEGVSKIHLLLYDFIDIVCKPSHK